MKFWEKAFSEQGILQFVIRNVLNDLNANCNKYVSLMSSGKLKIEFDDKLNETIQCGGREIQHISLSGGEKRKINIAIMLALQDLLSIVTGSNTNILFLDEIAENLDADGINGLYILMRELKKDKDNALRYRHLEQAIKDNKATFVSLQLKQKEEKLEEIDKRVNENQKQINSIQKKIDEVKGSIESYKGEIKTINEELEKRGEQANLTKDIEELKTGLVRQTSRLEVCQNEIARVKTRRIQLKNNISDLDKKITELTKKKNSLAVEKGKLEVEEKKVNAELGEFKSKYGGNIEIAKVEEGIEKRREEVMKLTKEKQELVNKKNQLDMRLTFINDTLSNESDIPDISVLKKNFKEVATNLAKNQDKDAAYSMQLSKARNDLVGANEELAKLNIRSMIAR